MVTVTAEIHPPSTQVKTRKVFALGLVKVKLGAGSSGKSTSADELNVLGLLVVEDETKPTGESF
jgi:hypothetical protein